MKATARQLGEAGFHLLSPGVWIRGDYNDFRRNVRRAGLFISDFDECLHPDITQAETAMSVFHRIGASLNEPDHLPLFINICIQAAPIIAIKAYQSATGDIQNSRMIKAFERLARGVPLSYFDTALEPLAGRFFPGAPETLRLLSDRNIPTGIISLGLDIVIGGLFSHLEKNTGATVSFYDCTRVESDSRGRFRRYNPDFCYTNNEDKRILLRARVDKYKPGGLIVIGHDRDDLMMFDESKRHGGVNIGFRPMPETLHLLDAAVLAEDWRPIHKLLSDAFREGDSDGG